MSAENEAEGQKAPDEQEVRSSLLHFSELIRRLEREGKLMRHLPVLMSRMGDLRHLLFDYEVRYTERLMPVEDPEEREARRIVREAKERMEEMVDEWDDGWDPEDDGGGTVV